MDTKHQKEEKELNNGNTQGEDVELETKKLLKKRDSEKSEWMNGIDYKRKAGAVIEAKMHKEQRR